MLAQFPLVKDSVMDHFARSFRDELAPQTLLREIEELGIPHLVVDRSPVFAPCWVRGRSVFPARTAVHQSPSPE